MKIYLRILFIGVSLSLALVASAQQTYETAMNMALDQLRTPSSGRDLKQAAQAFERIAQARPTDWLPAYWGAYAYSKTAQKEADASQKDALLDQAEQLLRQAEKLQPANDEVAVLRIFLIQARLAVSPTERWSQYQTVLQTSFAKARQLNPTNPRLLFLDGRTIVRLPEAMGGSKERGCTLLKQSLAILSSQPPSSPLAPDWGKADVQVALQQCPNN